MTKTMDRPHVLMMSEITADGKLTLKKGEHVTLGISAA